MKWLIINISSLFVIMKIRYKAFIVINHCMFFWLTIQYARFKFWLFNFTDGKIRLK